MLLVVIIVELLVTVLVLVVVEVVVVVELDEDGCVGEEELVVFSCFLKFAIGFVV